MINLPDLEQSRCEFKSILPFGVKFHMIDAAPEDFELYSKEKEHTSRMATKRLNDFRASRFCARRCLSQLGIEPFALLSRSNRAPIWPDGIIGSISHTTNLCAAAVIEKNGVTGIGIDVETTKPINMDILDMICSNNEIKRLKKQGDPLILGKVVFSIKESIFKCFNPRFDHWLDFKDVNLELSMKDKRYHMNFREKVEPELKNCTINGHWFLGQKFILSSCWI